MRFNARFIAVALLAALAACGTRGVTLDATNESDARGLVMHLHLGSTIVGEPQTVRLEIERNGNPVVGARADISWSMKEMPMDPDAAVLASASAGSYEVRGFSFSMSGEWEARVRVRNADGGVTTAVFEVQAKD